jgi:hypothetical protein
MGLDTNPPGLAASWYLDATPRLDPAEPHNGYWVVDGRGFDVGISLGRWQLRTGAISNCSAMARSSPLAIAHYGHSTSFGGLQVSANRRHRHNQPAMGLKSRE